MIQSGGRYIFLGEEREDLMDVWEGMRELSPRGWKR